LTEKLKVLVFDDEQKIAKVKGDFKKVENLFKKLREKYS